MSQEEQKVEGYEAAEEVKGTLAFAVSLLCFLHSCSYHESMLKWGAKVHPQWGESNAACSCKSPSETQAQTSYLLMHSLCLQN